MLSVDRLNQYLPGTEGYVFVQNSRYRCEWVKAIIYGRTRDNLRRVLILHPMEYVFIEHEQQFQLTLPWEGVRLYHPFSI